MGSQGTESTPEGVFDGSPQGLALYRLVERMLTGPTPLAAGGLSAGPAPVGPATVGPNAVDPPEIRATKSQVAFRGRRRGFAYVWWPGRYVHSEVPAVLSIAAGGRIDSPRFKSVVHPSPGLWMHHLELRSAEDLDAEVAGWLRQARDEAD